MIRTHRALTSNPFELLPFEAGRLALGLHSQDGFHAASARTGLRSIAAHDVDVLHHREATTPDYFSTEPAWELFRINFRKTARYAPL